MGHVDRYVSVIVSREGDRIAGIAGHEVLTIVDRDRVSIGRRDVPGTRLNMAYIQHDGKDLPVFLLTHLLGCPAGGRITRFILVKDREGACRCAVGVGTAVDILEAPLNQLFPLPVFFERKTAAPLFWGIWETVMLLDSGKRASVLLYSFEKIPALTALVRAISCAREVVRDG